MQKKYTYMHPGPHGPHGGPFGPGGPHGGPFGPGGPRGPMGEKSLFEKRKSVALTVQNATFARSPGGLLSMTLIREDGTTEQFERVIPVRAFPITDPNSFICIREPDTKKKGKGEEIGMIEHLFDFGAEAQALIQEELERRYFAPEIKKIHSLHEKYGYLYFDVTTSAGRSEFIMSNPSGSFRTLEDGRIFMYDIDGNCYCIQNPEALDKASLKKIEIYL